MARICNACHITDQHGSQIRASGDYLKDTMARICNACHITDQRGSQISVIGD
jgi:predicted CXXCH cytochrome family protein